MPTPLPHRTGTVAFTNGAFTDLPKDESLKWIAAEGAAAQLVAFTADELDQDLARWVGDCAQAGVDVVAVHAPGYDIGRPSADVVAQLRHAANGLPVVAHPDAMGTLSPWRHLGGQLLVETMDPGKTTGRTIQEVDEVLSVLPDARVCLDISHSLSAGGPDRPVTMARHWRGRIGLLHLGCQRGRGRPADRLPDVDIDVFRQVRAALPTVPVAIEGHWSREEHRRIRALLQT